MLLASNPVQFRDQTDSWASHCCLHLANRGNLWKEKKNNASHLQQFDHSAAPTPEVKHIITSVGSLFDLIQDRLWATLTLTVLDYHANTESGVWYKVTPPTSKQPRLSHFSSTFLSAAEILALPEGFNVNIQSEMGEEISHSSPQSLPHAWYGN